MYTSTCSMYMYMCFTCARNMFCRVVRTAITLKINRTHVQCRPVCIDDIHIYHLAVNCLKSLKAAFYLNRATPPPGSRRTRRVMRAADWSRRRTWSRAVTACQSASTMYARTCTCMMYLTHYLTPYVYIHAYVYVHVT